MGNNFLIPEFNAITINISYSITYRSHSYHKKAKHCLEFSHLSDTPFYLVGFSPVSNERVMIALMRDNVNNIKIYQTRGSGDNQYLLSIPNSYHQRETFLVCIDTDNNMFSFTQDSSYNSSKFYDFYEYEEWYALSMRHIRKLVTLQH